MIRSHKDPRKSSKARCRHSGIFLAGIQSNYCMIQILPIGIGTLNQSHFPPSLPLFQSLLPLNSGFHGLVQFVPNQLMNTMALGKSFYKIAFVLPNSLNEV